MSHYEEVCRTNSFVTFEYRDTCGQPQEQPTMPVYDTHHYESDHKQHDEDLRSYNPYVIAYHENTNTFTYNDPWVEITHEDVCNSNSIDNNVNEQNSTQWSLPTATSNYAEPTVNNTTEGHQGDISSPPPPQQQPEIPQSEHKNDLTNNSVNRAAENPPQLSSSPAVVEKIVEHVIEEVSLSRDHSLSLSLLPKRKVMT